MVSLATVSATCLNQFPLDFQGNLRRIISSIEISKQQGSRFRCGPELEISGYNCEDHFYEQDTINHSWEILAEILKDDRCQDILVDVGMPIMFKGVTYNCRVVFLNKKILLIRPKLILCDNGNYRESRWFTGWTKVRYIEDFRLPKVVQAITDQMFVPFGDALLDLHDTSIGFEVCEELWTPTSSHIDQSLAGAEIIINGSGSHTEIRKSSCVVDLMKAASAKCGIAYVFCNLRGCDGERVYLNGISSIILNGDVLKLGEQYSLMDVEVLTAAINLDAIRSYKSSIRSRSLIAASVPSYPSVRVDWCICGNVSTGPTLPLENVTFIPAEEEIARGPALWMWDYLRRSGASGFFLPLSGGVDSSSVAIIVYSMCTLITEYLKNCQDEQVLRDVRKVVGDQEYFPQDAASLCGKILTTCYMGSVNSSQETKSRAENLANAIGSNHFVIDISSATKAFVEELSKSFDGTTPSFQGERVENLALQNVQARSRMVYAYLFAQLVPWKQQRKGFLLVVGTANVDEAIRGYFTKYDCSAADLNPIGGISKTDLKNFILYAGKKFKLEAVREIVEAPPTAELQPLESNQTDEQDMGMTYDELSCFGKLRKPQACGPFSMAAQLLQIWKGKHTPEEIVRKVKHFYTSYAMNRHKMSILTPACHMENYSPEDHRYDLRPLFYPTDFTWQFKKIDDLVQSEVD